MIGLHDFADGNYTGRQHRAVLAHRGDHRVAAVIARDNAVGADRGDQRIVAGPDNGPVGRVVRLNRRGQRGLLALGQPQDLVRTEGQPQGETPEQLRAGKPKQKQRLKRSDLLQHGTVLLFIDVMAGLTDETLQHFSPGRAAEVADVWLDAAGFIAGAVIVAAVWLIIDAAGRKVVK